MSYIGYERTDWLQQNDLRIDTATQILETPRIVAASAAATMGQLVNFNSSTGTVTPVANSAAVTAKSRPWNRLDVSANSTLEKRMGAVVETGNISYKKLSSANSANVIAAFVTAIGASRFHTDLGDRSFVEL